MFAITHHKGFFLRFINGYTVSVQWGSGNYCSERYSELSEARDSNFWDSETAEVAFWTGGDEHTKFWKFSRLPGWTDDVLGYQTADQVAEFIAEISSLPSQNKT